jgi:DNA-directed RNA polymerase specialized sigma24 family protein
MTIPSVLRFGVNLLTSCASCLGTQDAYRRELLALRFAGELTVREIATLLGKPETTVKSDLRRTLQRLKGQQHED